MSDINDETPVSGDQAVNPEGAFRFRGLGTARDAGASGGSDFPTLQFRPNTNTPTNSAQSYPIGVWDFTCTNTLTQRQQGNLVNVDGSYVVGRDDEDWNGLALHGATMNADGLHVARNQHASVTLSNGSGTLRDKTLVVWVQIHDTEETIYGSSVRLSGSAISMESGDGAVFDGLVYREGSSEGWSVNGNDNARTQPSTGYPAGWTDDQKNAVGTLVRLVAVYKQTSSSQDTVTLYQGDQHNGNQKISHHEIPSCNFDKANLRLVFGKRSGSSTSDAFIKGTIKAALLYDRAVALDELPSWS
ncbi:MAG: hypothetical protein AAGF11_21950 [Myxococcota bacterium]